MLVFYSKCFIANILATSNDLFLADWLLHELYSD